MEFDSGARVSAGKFHGLEPIAINSRASLPDVGLLSPKMQGPISAPADTNGAAYEPSRFRSASIGGFDGEANRFEEARIRDPKSQNPVLSTEDRLFFLEKEYLKLIATTKAAERVVEEDHSNDKLTDKNYSRYTPLPTISRLSSEDWRDVKRGRFAVPEPSVLTVSSYGRNWASGRRIIAENFYGFANDLVEESSVVPATLVDISPERPYRVAIHGYELHRALEVIIGSSISLHNNVFIWPFKHFVSYEKKIKQRLEEEEHVLRKTEDASTSSHTSRPSIEIDEDAEGPLGERWSEESATPSSGKVGAATRLRDQLQCLVDFLDEDMKEIFSVQRKIADGSLKLIAFEYLWLLYKPGDLVFTGVSQRRAYRVLHVTGGRAILDFGDQPSVEAHPTSRQPHSWEMHEDEAITYPHSRNTPLVIDCFYIDFDGENFGPVPRRFVIQEYEGEQPIDSLHAFPAVFDPGHGEIQKTLLKRGKRFVKLAGVSHKKYSGLSVREPSVKDHQDEVNSEIVIDFAVATKEFRRDIPGWMVGLGAGVIERPTRADPREISEVKPCSIKGCTLCKVSDIFDDSRLDLERRSEFLDSTSLVRYRAYGKASLSEDQLVLLPPRVYGYSLLDRKWFPLNIDLVEDIKTDTGNGFDDLVLPGEHKRIMQALVRHHARGSRPTFGKAKSSDFSTDLVRGKGRGLIILLHGVPGVGKTSTAECVATQTKRPLFPITCGDIGTTALEVESCLESYFDLAHKWGCVLLLDEADVYLARRERGGDLQRNSLVSVFLRVLEYYSGILILTTNRVGEFDEAFKSRIHISLYYPKLDRESTLKIWNMNIKRIQDSDIDIDVEDEKIRKFAKDHWSDGKRKLTRRWNGRQIKNAFQTAIALAKWDFNDEPDRSNLERPLLSEKQFEIVSQTSAHFDDYITNVHGFEEDDTYAVIAEREMLRKDSVQSVGLSRRKDSTAPRKSSRLAIGGTSKRDTSDSENSADSEEEDDKAEQRKLELKLEKLKERRKSATKTEDKKEREKEQPARRSKKVVESSSGESEDE